MITDDRYIPALRFRALTAAYAPLVRLTTRELERARRKAESAGAEIGLEQGLSTDLPYADPSFVVVFSTLFFHQLTSAAKATTAAEVARVLIPGGRLHVADWGRPADQLMRAVFIQMRLLDGFETTRDNVAGALPAIFTAAGLDQAQEADRLRTPLGTLCLWAEARTKR